MAGCDCSNDGDWLEAANGRPSCVERTSTAGLTASCGILGEQTDTQALAVCARGCWMPRAMLVLAGSALILGLAAGPAWGG